MFPYRAVAQTTGFATNRPPSRFQGLERCENILRYVRAWRQVFAMAGCSPWRGTPKRNTARQIARKVLRQILCKVTPPKTLTPAGHKLLWSLYVLNLSENRKAPLSSCPRDPCSARYHWATRHTVLCRLGLCNSVQRQAGEHKTPISRSLPKSAPATAVVLYCVWV
jgi:hypothetical protein